MVVFPPLDQLRRRQSSKWRTYDADVLPMPVAELDVALAEPIARALHEAVDRSDTGYPSNDGSLQAAFVDFAQRRWSWRLDPAQVRASVDVSVGAIDVLRAALAPGAAVAISSPVYPPFHRWPAAADRPLVDVPLLVDPDEQDWRLDLAGIEVAFAAGAGAYVLCHPHNPLGHLHPPAELAALAELADRHGALVVSDEIHAPLTLPGQVFTPYLSVSEAARRTGVALHSASKAWNLAGLKSAFIITDHPQAARRLARLSPDMPWHAGHFGAIAATAAYRHGEPWLDELLPTLAANHTLLHEELAARLPAARVTPAQAGYLAWVDLRALNWGLDPARPILTYGRLALGIGSHFGPPGAGHVRVNVGCDPQLVPEAARRMARAGQELGRLSAG